MENETITIRSSVLPDLMRKTLWRGTLLGGIGVFALLFGGVFIPVEKMKVWGPLLFLFSLGLITWGLLPYKHLKRLENKPSRLIVEGDRWLHYSAGGKPLLSLPIASIAHIMFIDKPSVYGIGIFLKGSADIPIRGDLSQFRARSQKMHQCDLFFPYFSRRSFNELHDHLI